MENHHSTVTGLFPVFAMKNNAGINTFVHSFFPLTDFVDNLKVTEILSKPLVYPLALAVILEISGNIKSICVPNSHEDLPLMQKFLTRNAHQSHMWKKIKKIKNMSETLPL